MDGPMGGRADGPSMTRREAIASAIAVAGAVTAKQPIRPTAHRPAGRLKQSASRWCYRPIPLPDLCKAGKAMGLAGIDLLASDDWPIVRQQGLVCSMGYAALRDDFIPRGFNDPESRLARWRARARPAAGGAARRAEPHCDVRQPPGTERRASDGGVRHGPAPHRPGGRAS